MQVKVLISLLFLSFDVNAQVFQWIDENNVIHFGDAVPEKYKTSANQIEIKTNVIETVKSPKIETFSSPLKLPKDKLAPEPTKHSKTTSLCHAKWERYKRAKACTEACGVDTSKFSGSGIGRRHDCGCDNAQKPRCTLE